MIQLTPPSSTASCGFLFRIATCSTSARRESTCPWAERNSLASVGRFPWFAHPHPPPLPCYNHKNPKTIENVKIILKICLSVPTDHCLYRISSLLLSPLSALSSLSHCIYYLFEVAGLRPRPWFANRVIGVSSTSLSRVGFTVSSLSRAGYSRLRMT